MKLFGRGTKKRNSSVAIMLQNENVFDVPGYISITECEEVKRCVNIIADFVSNMTIMLMSNEKKGDVRLKNGLSRLVDIEPNRHMTRKNFIKRIVKDVYLTGNAVCVPEFDEGIVKSMKLLQGKRCNFSPDGDGYKITYNGSTLYPDEVLHFIRDPDSTHPWKGLSCANALKNTITTLAQANKTKQGFMRSEWKPSLIISVAADAEELQDADLREKILDSYTKSSRVGEPWLIPAGEIDVKEVKPLTLQDLAIQEGIKLDIGSIASALGVPGFYVGIGEYDKEAHNNFVATTVMFAATDIQQELTKKLIYSPDWYFKFNGKSLMQFSQKEQSEFVRTMVGGGMLSRNEGRNEFDYSPVNKEGMDDYQVLENYIPVDKLGDQKKLNGKEDTESDE